MTAIGSIILSEVRSAEMAKIFDLFSLVCRWTQVLRLCISNQLIPQLKAGIRLKQPQPPEMGTLSAGKRIVLRVARQIDRTAFKSQNLQGYPKS